MNDFRQLYTTGRIKKEVLERIIIQRKGADDLVKWKSYLLAKSYDENISPRIGVLRANWKSQNKIDMDTLVQPLLFRVLCSYLDQGISLWKFPTENKGFLASIRDLERNSFTSFFKTRRAKELLFREDCEIKDLLDLVVGNEAYYEQYLFDQQFSHQGWSGMVSTIEDQPHALLDRKNISLRDLIVFELLLEIDALDFHFGKKWEPLDKKIQGPPINLFADVPATELQEVFKIWQDAFEWSYYDQVLAGIAVGKKKSTPIQPVKSFQAMFCIDERECSIRRHIESVDKECETFGTPGFFTVEFYFQPENGKFYDKLCPAPVTPTFLIKEYDVLEKRKHDLLYTKKTHQLITGFFSAFTFGFWAGIRLIQNLFKPKMSPAISNAFAHMNEQGKLTIENKDIKLFERQLVAL